ncbi:MAG: pimeloyl-ACP methyl ester carboxylesterase [Planctomycetota bacterium]|jgi:pimeloyl-ACP methyl ester carboxylesterase
MQYEINGDIVYANTGGVEHKQKQRTIVFVHGAGLDHTTWVLFNRFFARSGFNTFAVDLPGHGMSKGDPLSSVEQMSQWLGTFLDKANIDTTGLIGHSLGSLVTIETASRMPDRINNVILLGTACPMPVGEPLLSAAKENKHSAIDIILLYGHAYNSQLGGNPVAGINIVNSSMRLLERALDSRLFTDLNACNEYTNGLIAAAEIQVPVTLILGKEDKMTPPVAASALIESLNNKRVEILSKCGHMMLTEQPELVHKALVRALK